MGEEMGYFDDYDDQYDFEENTPEREDNHEGWDELDRFHALEKMKDSLLLREETIVLRSYILDSSTVLSPIQKATIILNAIQKYNDTNTKHPKDSPKEDACEISLAYVIVMSDQIINTSDSKKKSKAFTKLLLKTTDIVRKSLYQIEQTRSILPNTLSKLQCSNSLETVSSDNTVDLPAILTKLNNTISTNNGPEKEGVSRNIESTSVKIGNRVSLSDQLHSDISSLPNTLSKLQCSNSLETVSTDNTVDLPAILTKLNNTISTNNGPEKEGVSRKLDFPVKEEELAGPYCGSHKLFIPKCWVTWAFCCESDSEEWEVDQLNGEHGSDENFGEATQIYAEDYECITSDDEYNDDYYHGDYDDFHGDDE